MHSSGIGFIPETSIGFVVARKKKLSDGVFILSENNNKVLEFKKEIERLTDCKLSGGVYLMFNGDIDSEKDGTLYEVFQSYGLALSFFYGGLATCRAVKDFSTQDDNIFLNIDKYDKFGVNEDDKIEIIKKDINRICPIYRRIFKELSNNKYNPLANSLDFFTKAIKEVDVKSRILYLAICLEGLFVNGDDNTEISYKLGLRCSYLLNKYYKDANRKEIDSEIKNSYKLRSRIIHGCDYKNASDKLIRQSDGKKRFESDHVISIENILKRLYKIVLENYYEESVGNNLSNKIDEELLNH